MRGLVTAGRGSGVAGAAHGAQLWMALVARAKVMSARPVLVEMRRPVTVIPWSASPSGCWSLTMILPPPGRSIRPPGVVGTGIDSPLIASSTVVLPVALWHVDLAVAVKPDTSILATPGSAMVAWAMVLVAGDVPGFRVVSTLGHRLPTAITATSRSAAQPVSVVLA